MVMRFPWTATRDAAMEALRVDEEDAALFDEVFDAAKAAFSPRAIIREVQIDALGDDFAMLSGVWFEGARIAEVLADAKRVWAYLATAGEKPDLHPDDPMVGWWLQTLGEMAVHEATRGMMDAISVPEGLALSSIAPGSLGDWPITQQQPLFSLLGEVAEALGVHLTESCLMLPRCSVSGVAFLSPSRFCSCAHCPRENCPNRRERNKACPENVN